MRTGVSVLVGIGLLVGISACESETQVKAGSQDRSFVLASEGAGIEVIDAKSAAMFGARSLSEFLFEADGIGAEIHVARVDDLQAASQLRFELSGGGDLLDPSNLGQDPKHFDGESAIPLHVIWIELAADGHFVPSRMRPGLDPGKVAVESGRLGFALVSEKYGLLGRGFSTFDSSARFRQTLEKLASTRVAATVDDGELSLSSSDLEALA